MDRAVPCRGAACCAPTPMPSPTHPSRAPRLQPALQKLRRQPLQPSCEQREPIGEEQKAQENEQRSRDAVHPTEVAPEPLEPAEEPLQRERGEHERNGEP